MSEHGCPSCGGPIQRSNPGIVQQSCGHCGNVVYWDGDAVLASGLAARLTQGYTRLFLGAVGEVAGARLHVLGRVRYRHADGFWDEWYAHLGDRYVWITEDDHDLALEEPEQRIPSPVPAGARPGERFYVDRREHHVEEVGEAVCVGLEGELPERYAPGESYRYIDASSINGQRCISVELDGDPPAVFLGRWLEPKEVALDADRPGEIGARPAHVLRTVQCPSCASPLSLADEATRLRVCDACGSHVALDEAEARVVARRSGNPPDFRLPLGHPYRHEGEPYEVAARLRWAEADEPSDTGDHYLLYSPRMGTLWLDEYQGAWTLTRTTHVAPAGAQWRNADRITTGDARRWANRDAGELVLRYVDGALPWAARVGDRVAYFEYTGNGGTYEINDENGEITYATGVRVSRVGVGDGRPTESTSPQPSAPSGAAARHSGDSLWFGGMVTGVVLALAAAVFAHGTVIADASFSAQTLGSGGVTPAFDARTGEVLEIEVRATRLDNGWVAFDLALVDQDELATVVADVGVERYHGVEGGESWAEGSTSGSVWVVTPRDARWHVYLQAVSGQGETDSASSNLEPASVTVRTGGWPETAFYAGMIVSVLGGIVGWVIRKMNPGVPGGLSLPVVAFYATILVGSGLLARSGFGAEDADDPKGISIRDESVRHSLFVQGRRHVDGGLSGGK